MAGQEPEEEKQISYGEGDGSDLIKNNTCNLQKMVSELFNSICENKEQIVKDPGMKKLVRDYRDNSLEISKFYRGLGESLRMEKARQRILEIGLQNETQQEELKGKLLEFTTAEDPFKNFYPRVKPLVENHEKTRGKLEEKIKGLDRKRNPKRGESKRENPFAQLVSGAVNFFNQLTEEKVTPATEKHTSATVNQPEGLAENANSIYPTTEEKVTQAMEENTSEGLVEGVNCDNLPIASDVNQHSQIEIKLNLAGIAEDIKKLQELLMKEDDRPDLQEINKLQEPLMQKLDALCCDVDSCVKQLHNERGQLTWA